jgi:hypothetical protein
VAGTTPMLMGPCGHRAHAHRLHPFASPCGHRSALKHHQVNVKFNRNVVPRHHLEKREHQSDTLDQSAFTSFLMLSLQPMFFQRLSEISLKITRENRYYFFVSTLIIQVLIGFTFLMNYLIHPWEIYFMSENKRREFIL